MVLCIFSACHFGSHGYPCHISTVFDYRRTGSDSAWVLQTLSVKLTYPYPFTPQAVCFNLVSGFILFLATVILLFAMIWHCQNEFASIFYITGLLGLIASILHIVNGFMCLYYMPGDEAYVIELYNCETSINIKFIGFQFQALLETLKKTPPRPAWLINTYTYT